MGVGAAFKIVLIVGQMRSGTSAVSEIVHRLGIPMGTTFLAPLPPTFRFEWEDGQLSNELARQWITGREPTLGWPDWYRKYLSERKRHAEAVWKSPRFGLKSPPWVLLADTLLPLTLEVGYTALIHVDRPQGSIDASVRATFPPALVEKALATNATICAGLRKLKCHLRVPYDSLVEDPKTWVNTIAGLLEVDDQDRIADAIGHVLEPTEKWQQ